MPLYATRCMGQCLTVCNKTTPFFLAEVLFRGLFSKAVGSQFEPKEILLIMTGLIFISVSIFDCNMQYIKQEFSQPPPNTSFVFTQQHAVAMSMHQAFY